MSMVLGLMLSLVAQTFDAPGSHAVGNALGTSVNIPSGAITVDLYWPTDVRGAVPIVVVGHGFARSAAALTGWGAHLASYGLAAAVPSFPGSFSPDHAANALRMRELIAELRASPGPITAMIDPSRSAVVGHSAGGLSALLAAADDPSISVVVGLDPVDANGLGAGRAGAISQSALVLAADAASCNSNGSAGALFGGLVSGGSWFLHVVGSTHCDGEDPSNGTCSAFCGGEDPARRALFRRYATAHLLAWLDCRALDYLPGGPGLASDSSAGVVDELQTIPGSPCGAPVDGGTPPPADAEPADVIAEDAANADAGVADGPREGDAEVERSGSTRDGESCGCASSEGASPPAASLALLLSALVYLTWRRLRCAGGRI